MRTLPPLGTTIDTSHPLGKNIKHCFLFNEGAGINVNDIANRKFKGVMTNMAFPSTSSSGWKSSIWGNDVCFDGSNDEVDVTALDIPQTDGSVSFWWRPLEDINSGAITHSIFQVTAAGPVIFEMFRYSDGRMYSGWYTNTSGDRRHIWIPTGLTVGKWFHIVLRWKAGVTTQFFLNGQKITNLNPTDSPVTWDTTGQTFKFGYDTTGPTFSFMELSNFRIYDKYLSDDAIWSLYRNPMAGLTVPKRKNIRHVPAAGASQIKTWNGIDWSNVKTWNGIPVAEIKTLNGIANS